MSIYGKVADKMTAVGLQLANTTLTRAANQTVDDALEFNEEHSQDSQPRSTASTFIQAHKGVIGTALKAGISAAIPPLLASTKFGPPEYTDKNSACEQQSAIGINSPNYGTNANSYFNGAPPAWLSPGQPSSFANLQHEYSSRSQAPSPTITCSRSRAPDSGGHSDSADSTTRSKHMCAPTSVQSAHDPRASYFTPGLDWVHGQIYHDPFARSSPSIVFQYDQEQVSSITEGTMTDIPRARDGSTADQSELDLLEEDAFSRNEQSDRSADPTLTAYREGSSQW